MSSNEIHGLSCLPRLDKRAGIEYKIARGDISMPFNLKNARHLSLPEQLPAKKDFIAGIRRAPDRGFCLTPEQAKVALKNALRYIPASLHEEIASEFFAELVSHGRIYGYRYRPEGSLKAKAVDAYPGKILAARAFQVMIDNNLDFEVALYPYELVT
jgi:urocanate hydratase